MNEGEGFQKENDCVEGISNGNENQENSKDISKVQQAKRCEQ